MSWPLAKNPIVWRLSDPTTKKSRTISTDTPILDAQVLLAHVLNKPRSWLLAHPEVKLTPEQETRLTAAQARLRAGEPLPYITGHWEFYGLDFQVTPDVLIPRPETELLVERAIGWLGARPGSRLAIDVGTGSGCIAISLAAHIPDLSVIAIDISLPALQVANANALRHGILGRVQLLRSDLFEALNLPQGSANLITANLPYIPSETLRTLEIYGKEPDLALDGGPDGLEQVSRLLVQAPAWLAPGGLILLEIEYRQGAQASVLARAAFPRAKVCVIKDLAGHDRIIEISHQE